MFPFKTAYGHYLWYNKERNLKRTKGQKWGKLEAGGQGWELLLQHADQNMAFAKPLRPFALTKELNNPPNTKSNSTLTSHGVDKVIEPTQCGKNGRFWSVHLGLATPNDSVYTRSKLDRDGNDVIGRIQPSRMRQFALELNFFFLVFRFSFLLLLPFFHLPLHIVWWNKVVYF